MPSEKIDKRALRRVVRTYIHGKGSVPEKVVISDLVQRYKVDEASIARAVKNQIESRRIERVPGVGLREYHRKRRRGAKLAKARGQSSEVVTHPLSVGLRG